MHYRALTVSREYGSGGGPIAGLLARKLGWQLLDNELITAIAHAARVDPAVVRNYDEHVDSWLHRLNRNTLWSTAMAAGAPCSEQDFFDADCMAAFTKQIVEKAYETGHCVIVGRGGGCILQGHRDVFRAFVYGPQRQKIERVRARTGKEVTARELAAMDAERARYIRSRFGCDWTDPHLYDLLISSARGEEATAEIILHAMGEK